MSDSTSADEPGEPGGSSLFQNFQHTPVGARVPEKVGRGAFATAMMVLQTNDIFVIDFLAMSSQPQQIVARIIMTAHSFSQFLGALRLNVKHYENDVGPLKPRITPPHGASQAGGAHRGNEGTAGEGEHGGGAPAAAAPHPELENVHDTTMHSHHSSSPPAPITELYEQIKFPEELLGGSFANAVMIRHTPEEFCFDFISSLYPKPIVVSRIYAAAGRVPSFLDAMGGSLGRYERGGQS